MKLLNFQQKILDTDAKIVIWEKSRQIGATWTMAMKSCLVSGRKDKPLNTWFSSYKEDAGKLFIDDVGDWAVKLNQSIKQISTDVLLNDESGIKATIVDFASGRSVYSLSSSPRNMRGKRGSVILDEFAFHDNQKELWKATTPVIRWGGTITVLSSSGLENDYFNELIEKAKNNPKWYFQQTTIIDAINDGIVEAVFTALGIKRKPTKKDIDTWLQNIRDECIDEETFLQEYMCVPMASEGDYWLPWDLITAVESKSVCCNGTSYKGGKTIIGHDVARRKDNSVFVVFELIGDVAHLVDLKILKNQSFANQTQAMKELVKKYNPYRIYVDKSGMGEKVVEDFQSLFGKMRVEGILFTQTTKQDMAINAKQIFEDKKIRLPFANELIRADLRKIKKIAGTGNVPKFDTERDVNGHGDIAWSIFLALLGLKKAYQPYKYRSAVKMTVRGNRYW